MCRDVLNRCVFVYLDDILIFSKFLQEQWEHVRQVLQRLLENRLHIKAEKYEFHSKNVSFPGFLVEEGQVHSDPENVRAVVEWPIPENKKQLQRFLGFANFYRRFIRNFSHVVAPLTSLTSPTVKFIWTQETDITFTKLEHVFTTAPVLVHPDPSKQFVVEVDASDTGVGAVLSQLEGSENKLHPCAFVSPHLSEL